MRPTSHPDPLATVSVVPGAWQLQAALDRRVANQSGDPALTHTAERA